MDSAASTDVRRYVIVGNGFAGTTAAEQLRKHDPACEVTLFGDEPYTLYNRISLPPMLRRQIPEAKVMIRNLAWHEEHRIALHLRTHVERIVPEERVVEADGKSLSVRCAADRDRRATQSDRQARIGGRREPICLSVPRRYARDLRADRSEPRGRGDRRIVHRLRARRGFRVARARDALADARAARAAPNHRRGGR